MLGESPKGPRPGRAWLVGLCAALALAALAAVWLLRAPAPETAVDSEPYGTVATPPLSPDSPEDDNADASPTERADRAAANAAPRPRPDGTADATPPAPVATAPTLRVESDVAGAMVFVDRKYLGTTPLVSRDVSPGTHQLNVQVEGREPVVQSIEIDATGETSVAVQLQASRLNAQVAVVHKHGVGSCEGMLSANPNGLRYQTSHDKDGFIVPFSQVESFAVDYLAKQLRVKQRGGRTWNFTTKDDNADPLLVFHRDVEAARP